MIKSFLQTIKTIKSNLETLNKNPNVRFWWRWMKAVVGNSNFVLRNRKQVQ